MTSDTEISGADTPDTTSRDRSGPLALLTACVVAASGVIWWTQLAGLEALDGAPVQLPLVGLIFAFVAVELLAVNVEANQEAHAITFSELPLVAGLFFAAPSDLLIGRVIGGFLVLVFVRQQQMSKLSLNLSIFLIESTVVLATFRALLSDGDPTDVHNWDAVFIAMLLSQFIGVAVVTVGITIYGGWPGKRLVLQVLTFGTLTSLANASTGLALSVSLWERSYGGLLFLVLATVLYFLHRAYMSLTERHRKLETLHDFTRSLSGSELEELEARVTIGAREILRGTHGALVLRPVHPGGSATRLVAVGDDMVRQSIAPRELASDLLLLLPGDEARLFEPGEPLPGWLAEVGVKDAAIVPLADDGVTVGALVVANRLTDVSTFVEEDLRLFETLANHANVALANGRLVATLQHDAEEKAYQALHDPVTGLPNRASLEEQLDRAVRAAKVTEQRVGLVFVDLDTFKEVNDTLGMATGDRLLVEVRDRLAALLPERAVLLRFTGDQFAVLVTGDVDETVVLGLADTIRSEFDTPFTSEGVSLVLGASLGVALYPDHAMDATTLMKRADAATYTARLEGSGIEMYAMESDPYAPRRLALAAELSQALEHDEVDVFVQPKLCLADGFVVGAEALVRWTHPRLGPLSPDQFIPAAEHTGVIRPLTLYVVKNALAQCGMWREAGLDLGISVNLSVRNLFDGHLVEDIGQAIADAGVPAGALTLELTESTVMGESHRSMAVLTGLHDLGVRLSVDDFGTGYSSLTHLRKLPVTELKIDKSFVMTMTTNDQDAVIVRALVDLGRSLGLRTVAEGVESPDARAMLATYDCDEAQGYLFSRPLPIDQFMTWLERQQVRRIDHGDEVLPFLRGKRRAVGDGTP